jgi:LL-diaminopimelate aminotransferase
MTAKIVAKYRKRLELMVSVLGEAGFDATMPGGSFYLYLRAPKGAGRDVVFASAEEASEYLIKEALRRSFRPSHGTMRAAS